MGPLDIHKYQHQEKTVEGHGSIHKAMQIPERNENIISLSSGTNRKNRHTQKWSGVTFAVSNTFRNLKKERKKKEKKERQKEGEQI